MKKISSTKSFDGNVEVYEHSSTSTNCDMKFSIYLPPQAKTAKVPLLLWLSGLTCTEENFMVKSGCQKWAADYGIALLAPDTSPRGEKVPDDKESWDFGSGAGFYVNATQEPWSKNYKMYDYVTKELPKLVFDNCPVDPNRISISGHSMGGHGAITCALKNPGAYKSVSAFSPIVSPISCPWGEKAFGRYLGSNRDTWKEYDSIEYDQKLRQQTTFTY